MKTKTILPPKHTGGLYKHLQTLALFLLALLIIWWFGRGLNWAEVRTSLGHANWKFLAAASLVVSSTYLLRAYRWRALLAPLANAGLRDLFIANVVGFSAFFLLGRAGEVVRPALLPIRDKRVRPAASFVTILVERICDFVAIVLLFAVNLTWFKPPVGHELDFANVRKIGLALLIAVLVGLATLILFERRASSIIGWLEAKLAIWRFVPKKLGRFVVSMSQQLATALRVLAYPRELIVTFFWTALLWFAIIVSNLFIIRAFSIPFGFRETVFVLGWALVGSLVPTPGGSAGAFHAAAAAGLVFLGVTPELAAAIAILVHLVDFAPALLFGVYYLVRGEITLTRLRQLRSTEPTEMAVDETASEFGVSTAVGA